ncbi:MAG: hypothetical protein WBA12_01640 [Catalinimonas sp.]
MKTLFFTFALLFSAHAYATGHGHPDTAKAPQAARTTHQVYNAAGTLLLTTTDTEALPDAGAFLFASDGVRYYLLDEVGPVETLHRLYDTQGCLIAEGMEADTLPADRALLFTLDGVSHYVQDGLNVR